MAKRGTRKCLHCEDYFLPDHCNRRHQRYCSESPCRLASKAASQRKWLSKPENHGYFSGPDQVKRVQVWRSKNPNYRSISKRKICFSALQDHLTLQPTDSIEKNDHACHKSLQDLLTQQDAVFIGFLATFCGSALQDDIASYGQKLLRSGLDILQPRGGSP